MTFPKYIVVYCFLMILIACCSININIGKLTPEYKTIDSKAEQIVNTWKSLAKNNGIEFDKNITLGFKDINDGRVIGLCSRGMGFREIDVDNRFWADATDVEKIALIYHELTHCFCERGHDYDSDKEYDDTDKKSNSLEKGFFEDSCPTSLMYPTIVSDDCFVVHYYHYVSEQFERCKAW